MSAYESDEDRQAREAALELLRAAYPPEHPDPLCLCTHPESAHNLNRLCIALPGRMGCGCLGFLRPEDYDESAPLGISILDGVTDEGLILHDDNRMEFTDWRVAAVTVGTSPCWDLEAATEILEGS